MPIGRAGLRVGEVNPTRVTGSSNQQHWDGQGTTVTLTTSGVGPPYPAAGWKIQPLNSRAESGVRYIGPADGTNATDAWDYPLEGIPEDFAVPSSGATINLSWAAIETGFSDDASALSATILNAAGTVAYTNTVTMHSHGTNGVWVNQPGDGSSPPPTFTRNFTVTSSGAAASVSDWDSAVLRLEWTYTRNMGSDNAAILIAMPRVSIPYTPTHDPGFTFIVAETANSTGTSSLTCTPSAAITSGRLLVALATTKGVSVDSDPQCDGTNGWTNIMSDNATTLEVGIGAAWKLASGGTAAADAVTFDMDESIGQPPCRIAIFEFNLADTITNVYYERSSSSTLGSTNFHTPVFTTTQSADARLIVHMVSRGYYKDLPTPDTTLSNYYGGFQQWDQAGQPYEQLINGVAYSSNANLAWQWAAWARAVTGLGQDINGGFRFDAYGASGNAQQQHTQWATFEFRISGAPDVAGGETTIAVSSATANVVPTTQVAGSETTIAVSSATGNVVPTTEVAGGETTVAVTSETADVTPIIEVNPGATTIALTSATAPVTPTTEVDGGPTTIATSSETAPVSGQADVDPGATTIALTSETAPVSATTPVDGSPTTIALTSATAPITATAEVDGAETTIATTSATAPITATTQVAGSETTIAVTSATANVDGTPIVDGGPTTIALTSETANVVPTTEVDGGETTIALTSETGPVTSQTVVDGGPTTIALTSETAPVTPTTEVDGGATTIALQSATAPVSGQADIDPGATTIAVTSETAPTSTEATVDAGKTTIRLQSPIGDNFNRANGGIGSDWSLGSVDGLEWQIDTNQAAPQSATTDEGIWWVGVGDFPDEQGAEVTITNTLGRRGVGINMVANVASYLDFYGYLGYWQGTQWSIEKVGFGTFALNGTVPEPATPYRMRLERVGNTISLYLNRLDGTGWELLCANTDGTPWNGGAPGISRTGATGASRYDDFIGYGNTRPAPITPQADIDGAETTIAVTSATADVGAIPDIVGGATTIAVTSATAPVAGQADVDGGATTIAVASGTAPTSTETVVDGGPTTIGLTSGSAELTATTEVDGGPTTIGIQSGTGQLIITTEVDGGPTTIAVVSATADVTGIDVVDPSGTTIAVTSGTGPFTVTAQVDGQPTTISLWSDTAPVDAPGSIGLTNLPAALRFEYSVRARALRDTEPAEYARIAEQRDRELEDYLSDLEARVSARLDALEGP